MVVEQMAKAVKAEAVRVVAIMEDTVNVEKEVLVYTCYHKK